MEIVSPSTRDTRHLDSHFEAGNESEQDTERASRETRNQKAIKTYEATEEKRIIEKKRKLKRLRRTEAIMKLLLIFFVLVTKEKRYTLRETIRIAKLFSFSEVSLEHLDSAFRKSQIIELGGANFSIENRETDKISNFSGER